MRRLIIYIFVVACLITIANTFVIAQDAPDSIIVNGSFESGTLEGWLQGLGGVDLSNHWQAATGDYSIDLNASRGAGSLSQMIATEVGVSYTLRFAMSANTGGSTVNDMTVTIGNEVTTFTYIVGKDHSLENMLWGYHTLSFTATEISTTIVFTSLVTSGAGGPALDDVSVEGDYCQMIVNGSFESSNLKGWQPTLAGVDLVEHWQDAEGNFSLDLNASRGAGGVTQSIATEVGASYTLRFAMSANPGGPLVNDMTVGIGSEETLFTYTLGEENSLQNMLWEYYTHDFTATNATTSIVFTSLVANGAGGPTLDNVRVNPIGNIETQTQFAGTTWEFGRDDGGVYAESFVLNADGTIGGHDHPNENRWAFGNGTLVFYTIDNIPSTCFTSYTAEGDMITLGGGRYLLDPSLNITHTLRQVTP